MNSRSLAHKHVQNQQMSSWIDDPFDMNGIFAGAANMNHQRNLEDFTQYLVSNYANYNLDQYELSLDMVPDDEQNELARLFIETNDRELTECVNGNDFSIDNEYSCALMSMLKEDSRATRDNFAVVTRNNILKYYTKSLNEILETACDNFLHESMEENGYKSIKDNLYGDVVWGKF